MTALFAPRLKREGHEVAISAFYGLEGNRLVYSTKGLPDVPVYPGIEGTYGNETVLPHALQCFGALDAGLVFSLLDVWVLDTNRWSQLKTAAWVPIDHSPAPPMVRQYFEQTPAVPIAMSRFGEEELDDFDPLYCPHAVDTSVYEPVPRDEARRRASLPRDAFIVGVVAANKGNPSRKSFPEILRAFAAFRERHDDALLYLHTSIEGQGGVPLPPLVESLGIPSEALRLTDQFTYLYSPLPSKSMASLYSAFDVLLNPATGEGFGIPVLESQACGTPAIVTDFSAMREVCGSGWKVEYEPIWTPQGAYQARPSVEDIVESLESAYNRPKATIKEMKDQAVAHAAAYDVEKVLKEHMLPALEQAADRLGLKAESKLVIAR